MQFSTFDWTIEIPIVATIIYGTGEYLGAKGDMKIYTKEFSFDPCKDAVKWSVKHTFHFTN